MALKKSEIALELYSRGSACFIWSSMAAKKRHRAPAEAMAPFQRLGFAEQNNVCDRILETEAVCGTLRAQQFYLRGPKVGNQAADSCLLARFIVYHLQLLDSNGISACVCQNRLIWGRL